MCLAVPGKIISIDKLNPDLKMAKVDFNGMLANVCIQWLPEEVQVGDYILAHVGMALNKIDEKEAMITLETFKQLGKIVGEDDLRFDKV